MNSRLKFHISRHMALRMTERGVSLEHAKNVVHYGDAQDKPNQKGLNGGKVKIFSKTDCGKKLVVVAELKNNDCWLMTSYYED